MGNTAQSGQQEDATVPAPGGSEGIYPPGGVARRRRLTVGPNVDYDTAGRAWEAVVDASILDLFNRSAAEQKHALSLTSRTDSDLARRKTCAEKDFDVLVPKDVGEAGAVEWLKGRGVAWSCRKALKPEAPNQDSISLFVVEDKYAIYGVYDGHGPCGHHVSELVCQMMPKLILQHASLAEDPEKAMTDAFSQCQEAVEADSSINSSCSGTTCTMAYHDFTSDRLIIGHVADSRAVLGKRALAAKPGAAYEVDLETVDHKPDLDEERKRIENSDPPGRVIFDGYYNHRVFAADGMYPGLNMSRAIGDVIAHQKAGVVAVPDIKTVDLPALRRSSSAHLVLIIASDGVWEFIESNQALELMSNYEGSGCDLQGAVEKLCDESYQRWMLDSEHNCSDDITAVLVTL